MKDIKKVKRGIPWRSRTRCLHCPGRGSIHGRGTEILQAMQQGKKKRKRKGNPRMGENICKSHILIRDLYLEQVHNKKTNSPKLKNGQVI